MRLFVTGGTGFIGAHFMKAALQAGHEISTLRMPTAGEGIPAGESAALRWVSGTLAQVEVAQLSGHDALLHFASYGVSPQPCTWEKAFQVNVLDSMALFQRAAEAGIPRIILCGSCMEYGASALNFDAIPVTAPLEPVGPYASSKAAFSIAASALCREINFQLAILRLFTVFGEGQHAGNFWPSLKKAALGGEDFRMTAGEQIRDFTPVELVATAFLNVLELPLNPGEPHIQNVGTGIPRQLRDFAQEWWTQLGAKGQLLLGAAPYRPNEVMRYIPLLDPQ